MVVLTLLVSDILEDRDIGVDVSGELGIQGVIKVYGYRKFCVRLKVGSISSSVKHCHTQTQQTKKKKKRHSDGRERKFET